MENIGVFKARQTDGGWVLESNLYRIARAFHSAEAAMQFVAAHTLNELKQMSHLRS